MLYNNVMKIIAVSDSHGASEKIDFIFKNFNFDYFIHLGDGYKDLGVYVNLDNVFAVRGNCDWGVDAKDEIVVNIEDKRIFITHGDNYGVKYTLNKILMKAKEIDANIVFFGHTHNYFYEIIDGITIINPGALKHKLFESSTAVIVDIDENKKISVVPFNVV